MTGTTPAQVGFLPVDVDRDLLAVNRLTGSRELRERIAGLVERAWASGYGAGFDRGYLHGANDVDAVGDEPAPGGDWHEPATGPASSVSGGSLSIHAPEPRFAADNAAPAYTALDSSWNPPGTPTLNPAVQGGPASSSKPQPGPRGSSSMAADGGAS